MIDERAIVKAWMQKEVAPYVLECGEEARDYLVEDANGNVVRLSMLTSCGRLLIRC